MPRPLIRHMKHLQMKDEMGVEGLLKRDSEALSPCQEECTQRLSRTIRLEQESYLIDHPEVIAMLKLFMKKAAQKTKINDIHLDTARYFTRPISVLDEEIREYLNLSSDAPYIDANQKYAYKDQTLEYDILNIILKHYSPKLEEALSSQTESHFTTSSSFLSDLTSSSTLPTPEPIPTPELTTSEIFFAMISNTLDKATFTKVTDEELRYDTAYVELMKLVEKAMEIPVIEIRQDIAELFNNAYNMFDLIIREKERIAAEVAWEKRMRKKLKRALRRQDNFKGYETPPTPKSEISSHASYKIAPQRPCECHPQWTYNRYPKDRFGIYLPRHVMFRNDNITTTPTFSTHSIIEEKEDKNDTANVTTAKK